MHTRRRTRSATTALAALATAIALAGCSSDPEPKFADPTPTPTPTAESTSASPVAESSSAAPDPSTPDQLVRTWIAAHNHALASGDTSGIEALAAQSCVGCSSFVDAIASVYAAGGHFERGKWTITSLQTDSAGEMEASLRVGVRIAGGRTVTEAGGTPVNYGGERKLMRFRLVQEDGAWRFSVIALAG
jgi:hypothetical protein